MDATNTSVTRRGVLGGAATAALLAMGKGVMGAEAKPAPAVPPKRERKIKVGLIGCGSRGGWLADLFLKHGGYEFVALADYFDAHVQALGDKLKVDKARRFSGLGGYKKLLETDCEVAMVLNVPYFYPQHGADAVAAGKHVYMAKPVAVDVPGTLLVGESAKKATAKNLCFLVDYQLPHDPACNEVCKRVQGGALGKMVHLISFGIAWHAWPDPPIGKTIEDRLKGQIWLSDTALSGDTIVSYDIHIIDGLMWVLGQRPVRASGFSRTCREKVHGDRTDSAAVVYEFADGTVWTHFTQSIDNNIDITTLSASLCGMKATAHLQYGGKNYVRTGDKNQHYSGTCGPLFEQGAVRNIADLYDNILNGKFDNLTAQRAVDGHLACILGREAAARKCVLTMDELIKENKRIEANLEGLKG